MLVLLCLLPAWGFRSFILHSQLAEPAGTRWLVPKGSFDRDIQGCHSGGGRCYWHPVRPPMLPNTHSTQDSHTSEHDPAPNVNSANTVKP